MIKESTNLYKPFITRFIRFVKINDVLKTQKIFDNKRVW